MLNGSSDLKNRMCLVTNRLLQQFLFIVPECSLFFYLSCSFPQNGQSFTFCAIFTIAGNPCCRDQFGTPHLLQYIFFKFAGLSVGFLVVLVFLLLRYRIVVSSSVSGESYRFSYMYFCKGSVIASTDISLFLIFFVRS